MSVVSTIVPTITRQQPPGWNWPLSIFLTTPVMTKPFFIWASRYLATKQLDKMRAALTRLVREYPSSKYLNDARKLLAGKP